MTTTFTGIRVDLITETIYTFLGGLTTQEEIQIVAAAIWAGWRDIKVFYKS